MHGGAGGCSVCAQAGYRSFERAVRGTELRGNVIAGRHRHCECHTAYAYCTTRTFHPVPSLTLSSTKERAVSATCSGVAMIPHPIMRSRFMTERFEERTPKAHARAVAQKELERLPSQRKSPAPAPFPARSCAKSACAQHRFPIYLGCSTHATHCRQLTACCTERSAMLCLHLGRAVIRILCLS